MTRVPRKRAPGPWAAPGALAIMAPMARIAIDDDLMAATLRLAPGERVSCEAAVAALQACGVIAGLLPAALALVGATPGPLALVVARGTPVVAAHDAEVSDAFSDPPRELAPTLDARERPRYQDLDRPAACVPGQVLARRRPPRQGRPGLTVTGVAIAPPPPSDATLRAGRGARVSDDGRTIVAEVAGRVRREGSIVLVREVLRLAGGAEPLAQAVVFDGDLVVLGDVGAAASLCVTGDLTVTGRVAGAQVVAGGVLRIAGGASAQARLVAGRDVGCADLSGCHVQCGGDLVVIGDMTGCEAEIGGDARVGGALAEGRVRVAGLLEAGAIGTAFGAPTHVAVGTPGPVSAEHRMLLDERALVRRRLAQLAPRLAATGARAQASAGDLQREREAYVALCSRERELAARCRALESGWPATVPGLQVLGNIQRGVELQICGAALAVSEPLGVGARAGREIRRWPGRVEG